LFYILIQNGSGCGFVEWHDPPLPKFWTDLLGDLRDEVWRLRAGGVQIGSSVEQGGNQAIVQDLQDQLKEQNAQIGALKRKYEIVVLLFIVFAIGLVAGKMCMQ
jgi:hypothetical protein